MELGSIFQSDSLKAADLHGKEHTVQIAKVEAVDFDDGPKLSIEFSDCSKRLVCNKTNANTIAEMYGTETDAWINQRITLIPAQTDFQGRQVQCIRVKVGKPESGPQMVPDGPSAFADEGQGETPF